MGRLLDYKIPNEIKCRIPNYFYIALIGELVSIFGEKILQPLDCGEYNLESSTAGWHTAFVMTCKKLDMEWLLEYHKTLPTYVELDMFNGEIEKEVIKVLTNKELEHVANSYYKYVNKRWILK